MDILQQSSSLFGSLKNAVLGNPVIREFTIGTQVASFGPGLLWKVFDGKKKSTGQDVSVFIFEKSAIDKYGRKDREEILDKMRKGPQQLTKLRHPRILTVQHPLEESRDSLAFAAEPVFASLSNVLEKHENFPGGMPPHLKGFEVFDVEKVYGLLQIAEGLSFLHNDASRSEGNLTPDNIIITKNGQWKLAGFHFSLPKQNPGTRSEYTTQLAPVARQDLNYLAPEWIFTQAGSVQFDLCKADMFSFGCLISAVYNQLKTPFDAGDNIAAYKKCTEQLSRLGSDYLKNVPLVVRDHVSLLLNAAGEVRADAANTITHQFFDNVAAMTLKYLESLVQRDDVTKSQFFKNLHHVLDKLPLRVLHQRVLPPLFSEFPNHMMIPFVLPNVFVIAEKSSKEEYMNTIFPELKRIFDIVKPVQVLLIFMQKMELMLKMTDKDNVKSYVLPLIFKALEAPNEEIQELVLTIIPDFVHMIDYSSLKNAILPRLKTLVAKTTSLRIRVNTLVCIGKLVDHMDKFLLVDEIFPVFQQIPSREPAVLMAMLGIYKQTLVQSKIHLEKDYLASKAIPFLLPLSIEPTLNVSQFNNFMSVIREMFDRVEQEHRTKLEQLQKLQDEQRSSIDFVRAANKNVDTKSDSGMMDKVNDLVTGTPKQQGTTANQKVIGSNSEFAKMFGLSDNTKSTGTLLGDKPVEPIGTSNSRPDVSSFDSLSSMSSTSQPTVQKVTPSTQNKPSYSGNQPYKQTTSNYRPMNTQNKQPQPNMAALDSMFSSQLNTMASQPQQNIGCVGGNTTPSFQSMNQPIISNFPMKQQQNMFQSQNTSMLTSQSTMDNRPNNYSMNRQQQYPMNSGILQPMNSGMSQSMNTRMQPPMNSGVVRPMMNSGMQNTMNSGILKPMNSKQQQPNLTNDDLNGLLL